MNPEVKQLILEQDEKLYEGFKETQLDHPQLSTKVNTLLSLTIIVPMDNSLEMLKKAGENVFRLILTCAAQKCLEYQVRYDDERKEILDDK